MTTPVSLTAGAIAEIKRLMAAEGFDTAQKLRVGVKGGGCSGMTYILGFDHPAGEIGPSQFAAGVELKNEVCANIHAAAAVPPEADH